MSDKIKQDKIGHKQLCAELHRKILRDRAMNVFTADLEPADQHIQDTRRNSSEFEEMDRDPKFFSTNAQIFKKLKYDEVRSETQTIPTRSHKIRHSKPIEQQHYHTAV